MYVIHKILTCIGILRNTDDSLLFRYKTFIAFLTFRFLTWGERYNFYYADCSSSVSTQLTDPTNTHAPRSKQLDSPRSKSQLTAFFKIPKNPSPSLPMHDVIHIPSPISYPGFLLWHLWLTHPPHASKNKCTQCMHLIDPTNTHAPRNKQLDSPRSKSQLTAFFKIPKNPSPSLPGMTSSTSPVPFPIWGFYYDICDWHILHAQAWTPALNVCT